jgi:DegV family protein with EDD domain
MISDGMISIVTDSGSMLTDELRRRYSISVVPMTITVDGREFAEGAELTTAEFYARLSAGSAVSTAAPSPGAFVDAYRAAADAGASSVLSIHTGAAYSATVASATVAAGLVDVAVDIVDTGAASFPVALCVWAAADEVAAGRTAVQAAAVARATATRTGSLFVVGVPELARRGGRFVSVDGDLTPTSILELVDGKIREHSRVADLDTAIDLMIDHTLRIAREEPIRVGVGHAVRDAVAERLAAGLEHGPGIEALTMYEVGPSVGAHTGPGTIGVVYAPTRPPAE